MPDYVVANTTYTWPACSVTTSTGGPWLVWVSTADGGDAATTWTTWTSNTSNTLTVTNSSAGVTWGQWLDAASSGVSVWSSSPSVVDRRTDAQRAVDEVAATAERARVAEAARIAAEARVAARDRAVALLHSMLDVRQRAQLEKDRFFEVIAGTSRRRYRIHHGTHGNVRLLNEVGEEVTSYCAQPPGVPVEDVLAAQKLMIETDEPAWLAVANARAMRRA